MSSQSNKLMNVCGSIIAAAAWFALVLQLFLLINTSLSSGISVTNALIKFFSFFTILTNLLVAFSLSISLLKPASHTGKFFSRVTVKSAINLYIIIVGIIYNLILRSLWSPQGWQLVADILLHQVIPAVYVLYWLFFVPKGLLGWKDPFKWLLFPVIYLIYVLTRGALSGEYPYPFLDVNEFDYYHIFLNVSGIGACFILMAELLVLIDLIISRTSNNHSAEGQKIN